MYLYIYIFIYRSEGFALTGYVVPGCREDGAWMLWGNSSVSSRSYSPSRKIGQHLKYMGSGTPPHPLRGGDDGDGDGAGDRRISPEHPSPILHAPRNNIPHKGNPSFGCI